MADRSIIAPWNPAVWGSRERYSAIAASVLGTTSLAVFFDHFNASPSTAVPPGWEALNAGSPTLAVALTDSSGSGWWQGSTTTTANTRAALINRASPCFSQSRPWYCASRFRLTTVPDANTIAGAYITCSSPFRSIGAGPFASFNAARFVIQHSGNTGGSGIDLGVNFDTNYHVYEWYGPGGAQLYGRIDGGLWRPATVTLAFTAANEPALQVNNGATAANQSAIYDWFLAAGVE